MKVHSFVPSHLHNSNPLSLWTQTKLSNIFDDLFFHAFFCDKKFLYIYFGVCCFFAIKHKCTNICDADNCNAKNFDAKNNVAKMKPQIFSWIYFCDNNFCVKTFLCKRFLSNNFLSIYFCSGVFCGISF